MLLFENNSSDLYLLFLNTNQIYLLSKGLAAEGTFVIIQRLEASKDIVWTYVQLIVLAK